jgi:hypothetical protein
MPERPGFRNGAANIAQFASPMGIAIDEYGRIFVSDTENHLIRMIYDGQVTTFAGERMMARALGIPLLPDEILLLADFAIAALGFQDSICPEGLPLWANI